MTIFFIDLGGHDGCSIRKWNCEYNTYNNCFCYTFEPNKAYARFYDNITNHTLISKAAYIYDGTIEMNMDRNQGGFGSSIIKEKKDRCMGQLDRKNPDIVECVDFSKWIKDNCNESDNIILKMDIEGSEYDIIEKMIKEGTIKYINKLFIEWHNTKLDMPNITERHNQLVDNLKKTDIIIDDTWCAIKYSTTYKQSPYYGKQWDEL